MISWFWWYCFFPKLWSQSIFFFRSQIFSWPYYKACRPWALYLSSPMDSGVQWPLWGKGSRASRLFCLPRHREHSWTLEIKTIGYAVPTSPELDKDRLEGDKICLYIALFQISWPWPQRTAAEGTLGQAGEGHSHSSLVPSPSCGKLELAGPLRDQIQSTCCFALLSAYSSSHMVSL